MKMNIQQAISERRSHRQYTGQTIPPKEMTEILEAGLLAPSPKNRQPWHFVSCGPQIKNQIISLFKKKIEDFRTESKELGSLPISTKAIEEGAELLLVYNPYANKEQEYKKNRWKADILSIGACIQNMLLTALGKDIQTLWICDILFLEDEINALLRIDEELVSGVVFGKGTRKSIPQRPRVELEDKLIRTD